MSQTDKDQSTKSFQYLPLDHIETSGTNPRKRFPETMLNELADSIRKVDVLQPILVRPHPNKTINEYEIVAGECRYRAAKMAEKKFIPAVIKVLTDLEAIELQILENLHRSDLHPMEEAEGFQQLLKRSQDLVGFTADELAAKIGKSKSYIYASLKLCELCTYARDAFYDGKLTQSTALLIARIPGEKLQTQAVKEIIKPDHRSDVMSFRAASVFIRERYMLDLEKAPFDRHSTSLCPDAGSCLSCPKRSGNYPELFNDIESADVCTDPDCFGQKKAAHVVLLQQSGKNVVTGEEAEKIAPYGANSYIRDGYDRPGDLAPARMTGASMTWQEALGDDFPEPIIVVDKNNNLVEVFKNEDLAEKLQAKIDSGELQVTAAEPEEPSQWQIDQERKEKLKTSETADRKLLFAALHDKLHTMPVKELPVIAMLEILIERNFSLMHQEAVTALQEVYDCKDQDDSDFLAFMTTQPKGVDQLAIFLMEILVAKQVNARWDYQNDSIDDPEDMMFLLNCVGVDPHDVFAKSESIETASTPPSAAQASESNAPEKPEIAASDVKAEALGDLSPAEAQASTPEPAAPAEEAKPLTKHEEIKAKALAKKAQKQTKKESAKADVKSAPAAKASRETTAQPA